MSAITETESGGEMVCILGFSARPRGARISPCRALVRDGSAGGNRHFWVLHEALDLFRVFVLS